MNPADAPICDQSADIEEMMNEGQAPPHPLPDQNTNLAMERTRLGAERTLMAWVRTSLSMISFGFTIYKFLQDLSKIENSRLPDQGPRNFGLALVGLGSIVLIVASIQYLRRMHGLRGESPGGKKFPLALFVAVAIAGLGVLAFISIMLQVGPF